MAWRPEAPVVEVAYARPDRQRVVELPFSEGMTVLAAVEASGLLEEFALDPATLAVGIYGRKVDGSRPLRPGDRVEIYRPLAVDPREARRRSARDQEPEPGRRRPRPG